MLSMPFRKSSHITAVSIGVILAVAAVLRFYHLGATNLWIDEILSVKVASQPAADIIRNYRPTADPALREQAPFAFVVMHFFLPLGAPEWSARLPSVLFGLLGVVALLLAARELGLRSVALGAAALLAISPLHVWYSQEVRWYAQWVALTMLSYVALARACKTNSRGAWAAYVIFALLDVYTFIFSFFVLACQGLSVCILQWLDRRRARLLPAFTVAGLVIAIGSIPVLWLLLNQLSLSTGTPRPTTLAALGYTLFAYGAGLSLGPTLSYLHHVTELRRIAAAYPSVLVVGIVFAPLLAVGAWSLRRNRRAAALLLPLLFGLPVLVFLLAVCSNVTYQARYSLAALPAFVIVVALGIRKIRPLALRTLAIAAVVACSCWSLVNYYSNPAYGKEDVRSAVVYVERAPDAQSIIPIGQIAPAVSFYGRRVRVLSPSSCMRPGARDDAVPAALQELPKLWVMVGRDWDGDAARCLSRLIPSHRVIEERHFSGVDLWLLARQDLLRTAGPQS